LDYILEIFKFIGVIPTFLLLVAILGVSFFFWYRNGLKIGTVTIFEKAAKEYPDIVKEYLELCEYHEYVDGDLRLAYFIPPKNSAVKISGKWDSALDSHKKLIERIERDWEGHTSVDIRDCNLSSAILSLIEDKFKDQNEMLIIHNGDQENMIKRYFSQFDRVSFLKK
jgi:hypothetical protein